MTVVMLRPVRRRRHSVWVLLSMMRATLLTMLVAQRSGGFYPAGCFCVFVLGLFAYTMGQSPRSYFQP